MNNKILKDSMNLNALLQLRKQQSINIVTSVKYIYTPLFYICANGK